MESHHGVILFLLHANQHTYILFIYLFTYLLICHKRNTMA